MTMKTTRRLISAAAVLALLGCNSNNNTNLDRGPVGETSVGDGQSSEMKECKKVSRTAELPPLDMVLALDTSFSMDFNQKWISVKAALKAFAVDPHFAQVGVGLQYFPVREQCNADDYAIPAVAIAQLSTSSSDIISSLEQQRMSGGTPMVPMLTGVISYARSWASKHTDRKTVVVMATDGIPDSTCLSAMPGTLPNTLTNVITVVTDAATGQPSVPVFVIGVGSDLTSLNQIAAAGGTNKAFLVDVNKDVQSDFLAALNDIRRELACEYIIPPPPSGETAIDFSAVNVVYTAGSTVETFGNVKDKASCSTAAAPDRAWYYDDPKKPSKIMLCPDTCKKVQYHDGARIDVMFGCKTIPA
jgi:Mg-chelatase subunit ChlD